MQNNNQETRPGSKINASKNDNDERKIFVGGISWESTPEDIRTYFSRYGDVLDVNLKVDMMTGRSRGFGFVLFADAISVERVCADTTHILNGKTIDPKPALASGGNNASKEPCKKIFVGGLDPNLGEDEIKEHFGQYGNVELVELPFDRVKNQRRAFVFVTFESEEVVDEICSQSKIQFGDKMVDVRKAISKESQEALGMRGRGGFRGRGRGFGFGGYNGYQSPYDYYGYGGYGAYGAPATPTGGYGDPSAAYKYQGYGGYSPNYTDYSAAGAKTKGRGTSAPQSPYHPYTR